MTGAALTLRLENLAHRRDWKGPGWLLSPATQRRQEAHR